MVGTKFTYKASELVKICSNRELYKTGSTMKDLCVISDGAVVIKDADIIDVGHSPDMIDKYKHIDFTLKIDAAGKSVIPGLVDSHTHAVFSGDRVHEFAMKLDGKSYSEISQAGGGIMFTVNAVKDSTEEELYLLLIHRLTKFLKSGTTLVECKTGYGITLENEVKMLRVIKRAQETHKITIICTYLPAHTVPPLKSELEMASEICDVQIPAIKALKDQYIINPQMIDVFCETGFYGLETTEKILKAGKSIGLEINFHGEELNCIDSGVMGARVSARAISHLEYISDDDINAMIDRKICGIMLPSTQYILHLPVPPLRKMIDQGVIVALGSDFNPNAWCYDMKLIMNLACVNYRMTMPEALVAATINSAYGLGQSHLYGSIEPGKKADLIVLETPKWEHIIYSMNDSPINMIFKHGELVYDSSRI